MQEHLLCYYCFLLVIWTFSLPLFREPNYCITHM